MSAIAFFLDVLIHLDKYIISLTQAYGSLVYAILFLVIVAETGLVIAPLLPGDSLLFVAGTLAAADSLNIFILFVLISIAAIIGDSLNYAIGSYLGPKVFRKEKGIFFRKEYLVRTQNFYEKHGGKTIILARFMPIIRTFAPFVAGIGKMNYSKFLMFNIIGGISWTAIFLFSGYFFGNIPIIKENLTIAILIVIFLSILPALIELLRRKLKK